jgi:RNA polymerase sigma factor, sigma-70 family
VENIDAEEYLSHLIDKYSNLVFSICYKITNHYFDAEDLTQETFLAVYKNLPSFDGQNEQGWICKIATNKSLDYIKRAGRKSLPTEDNFFQEIKSTVPTPLEHVLENDIKEELHQVCCQLKPPYKEVALDYFYREMTVNEISEQTGKNMKTLQTQIYRAKAMLKKLWRKEI